MLLGRSLETETLVANLRDHRLVTVVGPGGVGKTTLARHVLERLDTPDLPGYFVDLTELPAASLLGGIAGELGFGSFDALIGAKADDAMFLVLDNCEHLLDPVAAAIDTFMQRCPSLRILATSREPIELPGEVLFPLEPLPLEGDPSAAARLFVERARLRGRDVADEPATVQAICEVLDGLPLAIELAAAKTASMTPMEILEGLDRPIELLESPRSRRPDRHVSLGAAIEWSYDLLSDREQEALGRLSIFEGPFSMPMASAAIGRPDSASIVDELVAKSLVVHTPLRGQSWFRMLETIRAYAGEKLSERGQRAKVWESVVAEVLAELEALRMGPVRIPPMIKYGFATTRRVLDTCLERDIEPNRISRLIGHLWWLEDIGHQPEGADLAARAIARWPAPNPHTAISYGVLAGFQRLAGDVEESEQNARIAIGASTGLGAAFGHRSLGQTKRRRGEWSAALDHFTAAAEAARNDGEEGLALEIQLHTAITMARAGDLQSAIQHLEKVVDESEPYPLLRQWSRLFLSWVLITT
ncbi:MAG: hypothetical protein OEM39_08575, partial [Acidimicrobiia bacterium]|nr:hypothetical protein [Acidimicrobiia bacterium]